MVPIYFKLNPSHAIYPEFKILGTKHPIGTLRQYWIAVFPLEVMIDLLKTMS